MKRIIVCPEDPKRVLSTFPIVSEDTKQAAMAEYCKLLSSVGDQAIIDLITQSESAQLEFKSTAHWGLRETKTSIECFFIRTGNSTNKLDKPSDLPKYLVIRCP
jgi:hypothetical protein